MAREHAEPALDLVIGLDSSTTASKAIAFDRCGRIEAQAREDIPLSSPGTHLYEQDPLDWWRSARAVLRSVSRQVDSARIAALSISHQRETFVPLDADDEPVRPAIVWLDERCREEVAPFAKKLGTGKIHRITGKPPDYAPVVYRIAWMKRHEPDLLSKTLMISDVHSYLSRRLAGVFRTSWASADPLGLFDIRNKHWSPPILRALGLSVDRMPEALPPGAVIGRLTGGAASETRLVEGTPVVAGGGDGQAAGLGVNALSPEKAYLNLGTAAVCGVYGASYSVHRAFRTMGSCSGSGYYYECSLRAGTFAIDWFVEKVLGVDTAAQPGIYKDLESEAEERPAGSDGLFFLPYLCGVMNPYWDMNARGAFTGLSSFHDRGHLYRAILEGIAFEQALAIRAVEKATGVKVKYLATMGGGASSPLWRRIICDVTGKTLCLPSNTEASCLGAGISAAVGAGWFRSFGEAASGMTGTASEIGPDAAAHGRYRRLFSEYGKLYPALR
jgi:sugar (pentulose or hexulose) kinase